MWWTPRLTGVTLLGRQMERSSGVVSEPRKSMFCSSRSRGAAVGESGKAALYESRKELYSMPSPLLALQRALHIG